MVRRLPFSKRIVKCPCGSVIVTRLRPLYCTLAKPIPSPVASSTTCPLIKSCACNGSSCISNSNTPIILILFISRAHQPKTANQLPLPIPHRLYHPAYVPDCDILSDRDPFLVQIHQFLRNAQRAYHYRTPS